jgi:hypothetical protein
MPELPVPHAAAPPAVAPGAGSWSRRIARALSIGLHPFVVAPVLAFLVGAPGAGPRVAATATPALTVAVTVALVLGGPLGVLTWWQLRRGAWETVDASRPRDRPVLFAVALAALLALRIALGVVAPTSPVVASLPWVGAMVVGCAVLARWIKLSLHMLVAALAAVVLLARVPTLGVVLLAALPALGWSRVALDRHRWSEVLVGTTAGALAGHLLRHVTAASG